MLDHIHSTLRVCLKYLKLAPGTIDSLTNGIQHTIFFLFYHLFINPIPALACVVYGLRATHLIDLHLPIDRSRNLLELLKRHPDSKELVLLQFGDRFTFFANVRRLRQHCQTTLTKGGLVYVDIQGKQPVLRDCPGQLTHWLTNTLQPFLDQQLEVLFSPTVPTCMITLTGWALEYTVIYTSHHDLDTLDSELDEWQVRTNCLGSRCLNVVRIWIHHFGLPKQEHMLLSFSYPATLLTLEHQAKIEADFGLKIQCRLQETDRFKTSQVEVVREQVNLDRVAL
ncbi:hypothetical protein CLU79DRAFT_735407 [Phycomyces nitens]|nr:hypothetical protein CLU79DRAFT_735407 [Phycomyces nitens]